MNKPTVTVSTWTGREANLLRLALRQSQLVYAEKVGVSVRAVANWGSKGRRVVLSVELQGAFDRELERLKADEPSTIERFAALLAEDVDSTSAVAKVHTFTREQDDGANGCHAMLPEPFRARIPVSEADISAIRAMLTSLTTTDHQFGGGFARRTASDFLDEIVRPRLAAPGPDNIQRPFKATAAEFQMRIAWMHLDVADVSGARAAAREAFSLAQQSGDLGVCAWAMAMTALLETWLGDTRAAVAYGHAGTGLAVGGPHLVQAFAQGKLARALAAAGDASGAQRALVIARSEFDAAHSGQDELVPDTIRNSYDGAYILDEEAHCFRDLGLDRKAIDLSEQSLGMRGTDRFTRNRAFATGNHALSLARLGEIEHACASAAKLVDLAENLSSIRVLERLIAVRLELAPYQAEPSVGVLEERLRDANLSLSQRST